MCDYKDMLIDVEYRWPGSVHGSNVFANSSVSQMFRSGEIPAIFQTVLPGCEKVPN